MDVVALIFSIVAIAVSVWLGRQQLGLQKRVTDIETERRAEEVSRKETADIRVTREDYNLVLTNTGGAPAMDVEVALYPANKPDDSLVSRGNESIPILQPHEPVRVLAPANIGANPPFTYIVSWTDGGGRQEKKGTLTF